jgi:hypothetical protein
MYVIKDDLNKFVEKLAKNIRIFLRSDPNPVQLFRIRPGQKDPDETRNYTYNQRTTTVSGTFYQNALF